MKCEGLRKTHVVTIQVRGREGVRRTIRGVLNRPVRHSHHLHLRKVKHHLLEAGQSLVSFVSGLLLASLYGAMALFLQKQPLWPCLYITVGLACVTAFGMGLSASFRANLMVMMPSLCSARGRSFLIFLFMSMLFSGPITNILENTERAASSLLCGAELAANQTHQLMQRSATPLLSALDRIKEITRNAYAAAGRVQNLIHALTDSTRHVARTLRNVIHFLVDIGDICNAKLGSPYRKCRELFTEARTNCFDLLGDFDFLCEIVDGFMPLCKLAHAAELFCTIPSYIAQHLRKRLAAPVVAAFERMKQEFDFNITASVIIDLDVNNSQSLHEASQGIMEEVSSDLQALQTLSQPLMYGGLVLLAVSFLRAKRYRCRYLQDLSFDNVYINSQFEELDQQIASVGGTAVLPITRQEAKTYISGLSCRMSHKEQKAVLMGVASVLKHLVIGGLLVALDFLVFWLLDQVHHQVTGDIVARAPIMVAVQVNGSGYASDIYRDLVASFNVLQRGNITVISTKCLLEPSAPNQTTCFALGFLLGLALLMSLIGGVVQRCRRLICASYYPEREMDRIQFLHQHILDQRKTVGKALRRSATKRRADGGGRGGGGRGGGGRGGGGGGGRLWALLLRLPGGAHLSHLLGLSTVTCLACGEKFSPDEGNVVTCDIPQCTGLYCRPCFHSLGNTCVVCMRPLTLQEDSEEELGSSDGEQLQLGMEALNPSHITDPRDHDLMETRIAMTTCIRTSHHSQSGINTDDEHDWAEIDRHSDLSEADMMYQDTSESEDGDASFYSVFSSENRNLQNNFPLTVVIDQPENAQTLQDHQDSSELHV